MYLLYVAMNGRSLSFQLRCKSRFQLSKIALGRHLVAYVDDLTTHLRHLVAHGFNRRGDESDEVFFSGSLSLMTAPIVA